MTPYGTLRYLIMEFYFFHICSQFVHHLIILYIRGNHGWCCRNCLWQAYIGKMYMSFNNKCTTLAQNLLQCFMIALCYCVAQWIKHGSNTARIQGSTRAIRNIIIMPFEKNIKKIVYLTNINKIKFRQVVNEML